MNYHTVTTLWTALFPIKGLDTGHRALGSGPHDDLLSVPGHLLLPFPTGNLTFVTRQCSCLPHPSPQGMSKDAKLHNLERPSFQRMCIQFDMTAAISSLNGREWLDFSAVSQQTTVRLMCGAFQLDLLLSRMGPTGRSFRNTRHVSICIKSPLS